MSKIKQIAVYLTDGRAKELKEHHEKLTNNGKIVSLSSIVREVVDDFLDEQNELKNNCGCGVCEDKKTKVSSELAAAFGYNKELAKKARPKKIKNKETEPTIHSVGPAKSTK